MGHKDYLSHFCFDIGLAPLANGVFNHFKSDIKAIEYGHFGIPWIASNQEPYRELCKSMNIPGRLCTTASDWILHTELLLDKGLRISEGKTIKAASEKRGYQATAARWAKILNQ